MGSIDNKRFGLIAFLVTVCIVAAFLGIAWLIIGPMWKFLDEPPSDQRPIINTGPVDTKQSIPRPEEWELEQQGK